MSNGVTGWCSGMLASLLMPFLLALLFSIILEAPISFFARLYGNRRLAAFLVFLLFLCVMLGLSALGISHLFAEAEHLLLRLSEKGLKNPNDWLLSGLESYGMELLSGLTMVLRATPSALVSFFVTLFATYYLCAEPNLPLNALRLVTPAAWHDRLGEIYRRALQAFSTYLRAQAAVMALSTLLAMLGLYLLRVDYVLLLGLLIGLFDVLPVLGPGTLLVPWAMLSFWKGDMRIGWGLLLIYAVILVGRQIVEPKIIASGLGLHPLAALAAGFLGLQIFGAFGLLLGPLLASLTYFVWGEYRSMT
jgi:sporulation integral membrane protein YtvI